MKIRYKRFMDMFLKLILCAVYLGIVTEYIVQGSFIFLAKPFPNARWANREDIVNISCLTNDSSVNVDLLLHNRAIKNAKRYGQKFSLTSVTPNYHGKYKCKGTDKKSGTIKYLEKGVLYISNAPCKETPQILGTDGIDIGNERIFEKNDNFTMICISGGDAGHKSTPLTWLKAGNKPLEKNIKVSSKSISDKIISETNYDHEQLIVTNAQGYDAGTYICKRKVPFCSESDVTQRSMKLIFKEPSVPTISIYTLQNVIVASVLQIKINTPKFIICQGIASPIADTVWKKNGTIVKTCSHNNTCKLSWNNYKESDEGDYKCEAKNSEGRTVKNVAVASLVAPNIIHFSPDSTSYRMLGCKVSTGKPLPVIYWQKQIPCKDGKTCIVSWTNVSKDLTQVSPDVDEQTEQSVIKFLDASQSGTYQCVAVNQAGNDTSVLTLPVNISKKGGIGRDLIIGIVCVLIFFIIVFSSFIYCYKRHLRKKYAPHLKPNPKYHFDPDRTLFEQSIELPYDPEWEFPRERLELIRELGSGAFGQVWLANARGILALSTNDKSTVARRKRAKLRLNNKVTKSLLNCFFDNDLCNKNVFVAVKMLKAHPTDVEYRDLASEIKVLIHLGVHDNIVNLLGACTKGGNLCQVMEYCPYGNLMNFLRERRDIFSLQWAKQADNYNEDFSFLDVTYCALQIAKGMLFLSERKLVHRDLAARNVLVGADYVMKIADFGLARDIYATDFYLKESSGMLPVKWMAIESLFDKIYTTKSDVWSFGILLWEICTMGGSPYPGLPMEDLFQYLQAGNRMEKPATCPDEIYEIMFECWQKRVEERPEFHELVSQLQRIIESKAVMTNNLATFERLRSTSDETDYLVPAKIKKGSLDTLLGLSNFSTKIVSPRKQSVGLMLHFPPTKDKMTDGRSTELTPICENRYVGLRHGNNSDTDLKLDATLL